MRPPVGHTLIANVDQVVAIVASARPEPKWRLLDRHLELFPIDACGGIADAPGMREFGLWDVPEAELAPTFREMRPTSDAAASGSIAPTATSPAAPSRRRSDRG